MRKSLLFSLLQILHGIFPLLQRLSFWDGTRSPRREADIILEALSFCVRHPITDAVLEQAISLKQAQKLKTTDALIAATAIILQMPVLTADKEFAPIKGLDTILIEL